MICEADKSSSPVSTHLPVTVRRSGSAFICTRSTHGVLHTTASVRRANALVCFGHPRSQTAARVRFSHIYGTERNSQANMRSGPCVVVGSIFDDRTSLLVLK